MPHTETIERTYYKFEELSEEAQEKALENNRYWNVEFSDWHDAVEYDAKAVGKLTGFDIDTIYFSGFWSQGNGACFEGTCSYARGCVNAVVAYAPYDETLHLIVWDWYVLQRKYFYEVYAEVKHSGHYSHSGCTSIDVSISDDIDPYDTSVTVELEDEVSRILRRFMDWIYSRLEKEYEYLTSDEQVKESLIANEIEFDEDGNIA